MQAMKKVKIGKNEYFFGGEGANLFDALEELDKVKSIYDLDKCGCCGGEILTLRAYKTKTKGFKYIVVQCMNKECKANLNISENTDTGQKYYKKTSTGELDWKKPEKSEEL